MKLKIPKVLKAGAYDYTVHITSAYDQAKGQDNCGKTAHLTQQLYVDGTMHPQQQDDTFIHEMLHIVCQNAGYGDDVDCKQEELVRRLTPGLYQIFRDNDLFTRQS